LITVSFLFCKVQRRHSESPGRRERVKSQDQRVLDTVKRSGSSDTEEFEVSVLFAPGDILDCSEAEI